MSHSHTRLIWDHATASGNDLLVLLALADSADDAGRVSMSQPQIAAKIRADRTTVARSIEALIAAGHLEIADKASGSRAATYAICGVGLIDTVTRVISHDGETMAALRVRQARHSTETVVPLLTPEQAAILALLDRVEALEKRVLQLEARA